MKNKLPYLFLISLIGTARMAATEAPLATDPPKESISKHENEVLKKQGEPSSGERVDVPVTSFFEDVKNHPVLWGISYLLHSVIFSIANDYFVARKNAVFFGETDRSIFWTVFNGVEDVTKSFLSLPAVFLLFFVSFPLSVLLSLALASWKSRWRVQDEKGEQAGTPSFNVRFWRSFRFMLSVCLLYPEEFIINYYGLLHGFLIIYVVGFAHDFRKQLEQAVKKAIHEKENQVFDQKSNSLAAEKV